MGTPSCLARLPANVQIRLLEALSALGRSLPEEVDPLHFLDEFSAIVKEWIPHDRLVVCALSEDGRTFTFFAEHSGPIESLYQGRFTNLAHPSARHQVEDWGIAPVFSGTPMLAPDLVNDPRFSGPAKGERLVLAAGLRSGIAAPLQHGGTVVGAMVATSFTPHAHQQQHVDMLCCLADIVAPFLHGAVLVARDRIRRRRLQAIGKLAADLGGTLDVRAVFGRLAASVREALDLDTMGIVLVSPDRREIVSLVEFDELHPDRPPPERVPADGFTLGPQVLGGSPAILDDAPAQLESRLAGDRWIVESGARSVLCVPLWIGEHVGGVLYFAKREPRWYDSSDVEVASAVALQVALAIQHQRLAEEQRRLVAVETRARTLQQKVERLESWVDEHYGFQRMLGRAPAFTEALSKAERVAGTETTVLITGESGTGKELVAKAVHQRSPRREGPFVALNCAALPESLLESELFGYEKGAFTGADRARHGSIEAAAGGTLFLDEVGELSPSAQAKLLRVLQEREFTRVGGRTPLKADVRILAATNRDLSAEVMAGRFREDLYYRLAVFSVHMPPLRERGNDVLLLAEHFLRELDVRMGKGVDGFSREAREALLAHAWPGNIRELSNAIERAMIMTDGGPIRPEQLGLPETREHEHVGGAEGPLRLSIPEAEKRMVVEALSRSQGNRSEAARLLGLTRSQLYTRLKRFGLSA